MVYAKEFLIIEFFRKPLYFFAPMRLCWNNTKKDIPKHKNAENSFMKINIIDAVLVAIIASKFIWFATVFGFGFAGVYIFIIQILIGLQILPRVLYLFLLSEESSGKKHGKINKLVVLSSGLLTILVIFASPTLIEAFFPNYTEGVTGLQILALSLLPTSISLILTAKMQAKESTKVGYSAIVRLGSLLILIWILGSGYGIIGVSVAVVVSTILNTLVLYFLYKTISQEDNIAK